MPNQPHHNHALIGTTHVYRADLVGAATDTDDGGVLVVAPGMHVQIRAVFSNWNDVEGLNMLFVSVPDTGLSTHVTPRNVGLDDSLIFSGRVPLHPMQICEDCVNRIHSGDPIGGEHDHAYEAGMLDWVGMMNRGVEVVVGDLVKQRTDVLCSICFGTMPTHHWTGSLFGV